MKLYNTLTKKIEEFRPLKAPLVTLYTCGPTVYDYVSIGNFRTYVMADLLLRILNFNSYKVTYIMNITDVGHLTGDNLGDADVGEDRIEKAAQRENKSVWTIARFYEDQFKKDFQQLNLIPPRSWTRATDHVKEQIKLVNILTKKGYTYNISDGIYFDTSKFPNYGKLSPLDLKGIREGARVEKNPEKRNPTDFALWKFSVEYISQQKTPNSSLYGIRQMEWWFKGPFAGQLYKKQQWLELDKMVALSEFSKDDRNEFRLTIGFPGWHIECSAMSMKYLGETFDIHAGGEDLVPIHHTNEIAQSEAATGKKFVSYWVHGAFMMVDGKRMGKSLGNNYRLDQLSEKGFEAMSLRYLYLLTHYRQKMNFTWNSLSSAQDAYNKLKQYVLSLRSQNQRTVLSSDKLNLLDKFRDRFRQAVSNDLQIPQAVAVMWKMLKSNIPSTDKLDLLLEFDQVLGLNLDKVQDEEIPKEIHDLAGKREEARRKGDFTLSDKLRKQIADKGYLIEDLEKDFKIRPRRHSEERSDEES